MFYICSEYSIEKELEIPRDSFDQVQLTLVLPSQIVAVQLPLRSKLIRLIYERLNISGVFLGEVATMASLGSAHGTGLVINIDNEGVEVAAVNDFSLVTTAVDYFPKGGNVFISELKNYLNSMTTDLCLPKHFTDNFNENPSKATAKLFHNSTTISQSEDHPALTNFTFSDGQCISLPSDVFLNVFEKVFKMTKKDDEINLIDLIDSVIDRVDSDRRSIVLNHIIVTGHQISQLPNISACIRNGLIGSTVLSASDYPAESQPTAVSFRSIPEYYHDFKERGKAHIAWFGASLAGKYAFADSKSFIPTKQQHN